MAEIWSELLAIEKDSIGIDDNFFGLGGHSLNITILVSKIQKEFNSGIPLLEVFKNPTIRALSVWLQTSTRP
jgi:acyl carrier protein